MPRFGPKDKRRNFDNCSRDLGNGSNASVQYWSNKYNWQERVSAYDSSRALKLEDLKTAAREEAVRDYYLTQSTRILAIGKILDEKLEAMLAEGVDTDTSTILKLIAGAGSLDKMQRRLLGLPTVYKQAVGDDPIEEEEETLVIGPREE